MASLIAKNFFNNPQFSYVRLDRDTLPNLENETEFDFNEGFRTLSNVGDNGGQEVPHLHFHLFGGEKVGRMVQ